MDKVVGIIHDKEVTKIPVSEIPPGHKILIFDAILAMPSEKILCFSKKGLKQLILCGLTC